MVTEREIKGRERKRGAKRRKTGLRDARARFSWYFNFATLCTLSRHDSIIILFNPFCFCYSFLLLSFPSLSSHCLQKRGRAVPFIPLPISLFYPFTCERDVLSLCSFLLYFIFFYLYLCSASLFGRLHLRFPFGLSFVRSLASLSLSLSFALPVPFLWILTFMCLFGNHIIIIHIIVRCLYFLCISFSFCFLESCLESVVWIMCRVML